MVFIPVAIEAAVLAVEAAEGIVLAGEAAAVAGEVAEVTAVVNAGRLGSAMATATNTIALGKSGVFSLPFGGTKNPPRVNTSKVFDKATSLYVNTITITRPLGFYGVRLEAAGWESWYKKDGIKTPIERFYWGILSFDADEACIRQTSLKQSRQIVIIPEVQGLVNGLPNVDYDNDLVEYVKPLLPSRLSGFITWEDMTAQVSFFGVVEE